MTPERLAELRENCDCIDGQSPSMADDFRTLIDAHERLLKAVGPFMATRILDSAANDVSLWYCLHFLGCPTAGQLRELQAAAKGEGK